MSDNALQELLQHYMDLDASALTLPTLIVLDENAGELPANPFQDVLTLTNRIDVCNTLKQLQWPCEFNDFVFDSNMNAGRQRALYRISKEKLVVEHVLQSLWNLLPVGGELYCAGYKNEGIKTFAKRMVEAWDCAMTLERGRGNLHLYRFTKATTNTIALNDSDYHALHKIADWQGNPVFSKPGVFAWDRLDEGSNFLLEHLPDFLHKYDHTRQKALDLGCGYGLLTLALLQAGCQHVVATDNNAAALLACNFSLQQGSYAQQATVVAADCGDIVTEGQFDLLVCNPPFHQGFGVEQDMTDRFLQAAKRLLNKRGRSFFVVNTFIPLERKAKGLFSEVHTVADNRRYKLVILQK